jgi:glycosyltransferase involved in cell wall biosynthesis
MSIKITIITVSYNSEKTIEETIKSVLYQSYGNIEYVVVDGLSTDGTMDIILRYKDKISKIINEPDKGIYDAMNKGIEAATGDVIGVLNSDDFYTSSDVIARVASALESINSDILYGDLVYVSKANPSLIVRNYNSSNFRAWMLRFGWMPPHPSTFVKANLYKKYGLYAIDYKTGADYEIFVRWLLLNKASFSHVALRIVSMRMGGATTSGWKSYLTTSKEMVRALRSNGFYTNLFIILMRLPVKILERKWTTG